MSYLRYLLKMVLLHRCAELPESLKHLGGYRKLSNVKRGFFHSSIAIKTSQPNSLGVSGSEWNAGNAVEVTITVVT
jgi:hypothetical protein